MQAVGIADKLTQFIKENQNQVGWIKHCRDGRFPGSFASTRCGFFSSSCYHELVGPRRRRQGVHQGIAPSMDVVGSGTDTSRNELHRDGGKKDLLRAGLLARRVGASHTLGMAGKRFDAGVSVVELNLKPIVGR